MGDPSTRERMLKVLSSPSLRALVLDVPRFVPPTAGPTPAVPLAQRLRPHQRRLWWRRGALVLLRIVVLASAWLLAINGVRLAWLPDLPVGVGVIPALLLLLIGCWLAVAQRPTLIETARLLDRRFQLREQLGTAVELSADAEAGPLAERQVARATALLDRVPRRAWMVPLLGRWERVLVLALLAGATVSTLARPASETRLAATTSLAPHGRQRTQAHALPMGQQRLAARTGPTTALPPAQVISHARTASRAHPLSFAASFQMRPGPQAQNAGTLAMSAAPTGPLAVSSSRTSGAAHAGKQSGSVSGSVSPASRTARQGSGAQGVGTGAPGAGRQRQPGQGGSPQAGGSGQQGAAGQGNAQGNPTLSAPQAAGNTGVQGNAGQPGRAARSKQSQQPNQGQQGGATGGAQPGGANPFGQDAKNAPSGAQAGRSAGSSAAGRQTGAGNTSGRNGTAGSSGTGNVQAGKPGSLSSGDDPRTNQRRGASGSLPNTKSASATRHAGPATGHQVDLGGQIEAGGSATGPQIVRIEPLGASAAPVQAGTTAIGPSVVQGYVPEDDSRISPDEQALLRAYFSQGSN